MQNILRIWFVINQNYRNSAPANALLPGSYFHYAPDAAYLKINPMVQLSIREKDIQDKKQSILFRQVVAEKSDIVIDNSTENYSVFNAKYYNTKQKLPII
jgi:hypothetical protein